MTHIIAHPPALIEHLATAYLASPPPAGPAEKFWNVFIPISERAQESQRLVYGPDGPGTCTGYGNSAKEFVIESIVRGSGAEGRKRTTERTLAGWKGDTPENLEKLESLKTLTSWKKRDEVRTQDRFSQKCYIICRKHPIPHKMYRSISISHRLRKGPGDKCLFRMSTKVSILSSYVSSADVISQGKSTTVPSISGTILYEPDSADDIDDDDPDEDLEI